MNKQPEVKLGYYQSIGRRLISVPETAKLMGISSKTVYNEISKKTHEIAARDIEQDAVGAEFSEEKVFE